MKEFLGGQNGQMGKKRLETKPADCQGAAIRSVEGLKWHGFVHNQIEVLRHRPCEHFLDQRRQFYTYLGKCCQSQGPFYSNLEERREELAVP